MSDSLRPHGLRPTSLLSPRNFPSKNTGVGCHVLFQGIFPTQELNPCLLHCKQILYHTATTHRFSTLYFATCKVYYIYGILNTIQPFSSANLEIAYSVLYQRIFFFFFEISLIPLCRQLLRVNPLLFPDSLLSPPSITLLNRKDQASIPSFLQISQACGVKRRLSLSPPPGYRCLCSTASVLQELSASQEEGNSQL